MAVKYASNSPWYTTPATQWYLDILHIRPVSAETTDALYTIQQQFNWRPDLLAATLYGDPNLWWVFIQRNLDVLRDPIFDFTTGTKIYLPRADKLKQILGV